MVAVGFQRRKTLAVLHPSSVGYAFGQGRVLRRAAEPAGAGLTARGDACYGARLEAHGRDVSKHAAGWPRLHGPVAMRFFQLMVDGRPHLAIDQGSGWLRDLTSVRASAATVADLLAMAEAAGQGVDRLAADVLDGPEAATYELAAVEEATRAGTAGPRLAPPMRPAEVWCAGVTYRRSMEERTEESQTPDVYTRVYRAERPELFLKDSGHRVVGPFDDVGVRGDATWSVPEPELAFVVHGGHIAGYTVGNDVSSRDIEGENPLYLAQAKVYERSCAIGPCFVPVESLADPQALSIAMTIERTGTEVFAGETSTAQMVRTCEELCSWLTRHNPVPDLTVLLTGTGIVPDSGFTLTPGDVVRITIDGIGTLENGVRAV